MQLQGNEALGLGVLEGYFTIPLPETIVPEVVTLDVTAPNDSTMLLGNLMYSTFYAIAAGGATPTGVTYESGDREGIWPENLRWECFLAYDQRDQGDGALTSEAEVLGTVVADNVARITAKVQAYDDWALPIGSTPSLVVVYQIRATFM